MENYKGGFKKLTYDSLWFDIDHIKLKPTLWSTLIGFFHQEVPNCFIHTILENCARGHSDIFPFLTNMHVCVDQMIFA